jgi:hypothetical protein
MGSLEKVGEGKKLQRGVNEDGRKGTCVRFGRALS